MLFSIRVTACLIFMLLLLLQSSAEIVLSLVSRSPDGWHIDVDGSDLAGGPGSDLKPLQVSAVDEEVIGVSGTAALTAGWQLLVKRADGIWDANLSLQIEVTSTGAGSGSLTLANQFLTLSDSYQILLIGSGDRQGISIRLRLGGISISGIPAGRYTTSLVYTVVPRQ